MILRTRRQKDGEFDIVSARVILQTLTRCALMVRIHPLCPLWLFCVEVHLVVWKGKSDNFCKDCWERSVWDGTVQFHQCPQPPLVVILFISMDKGRVRRIVYALQHNGSLAGIMALKIDPRAYQGIAVLVKWRLYIVYWSPIIHISAKRRETRFQPSLNMNCISECSARSSKYPKTTWKHALDASMTGMQRKWKRKIMWR